MSVSRQPANEDDEPRQPNCADGNLFSARGAETIGSAREGTGISSSPSSPTVATSSTSGRRGMVGSLSAHSSFTGPSTGFPSGASLRTPHHQHLQHQQQQRMALSTRTPRSRGGGPGTVSIVADDDGTFDGTFGGSSSLRTLGGSLNGRSSTTTTAEDEDNENDDEGRVAMSLFSSPKEKRHVPGSSQIRDEDDDGPASLPPAAAVGEVPTPCGSPPPQQECPTAESPEEDTDSPFNGQGNTARRRRRPTAAMVNTNPPVPLALRSLSFSSSLVGGPSPRASGPDAASTALSTGRTSVVVTPALPPLDADADASPSRASSSSSSFRLLPRPESVPSSGSPSVASPPAAATVSSSSASSLHSSATNRPILRPLLHTPVVSRTCSASALLDSTTTTVVETEGTTSAAPDESEMKFVPLRRSKRRQASSSSSPPPPQPANESSPPSSDITKGETSFVNTSSTSQPSSVAVAAVVRTSLPPRRLVDSVEEEGDASIGDGVPPRQVALGAASLHRARLRSLVAEAEGTPQRAGRSAPLLLLDLDKTLIHSFHRPDLAPTQFHFPFGEGTVYVALRPRLGAFLSTCSRFYRLGVFTAAGAAYATPIADYMTRRWGVPFEHLYTYEAMRAPTTTTGRRFSSVSPSPSASPSPSPAAIFHGASPPPGGLRRRLTVGSATSSAGSSTSSTPTAAALAASRRRGKDLRAVRELPSRIVLLDDKASNYASHPRNGVPIAPWDGEDEADRCLEVVYERVLAPLIDAMASSGEPAATADVRVALDELLPSYRAEAQQL